MRICAHRTSFSRLSHPQTLGPALLARAKRPRCRWPGCRFARFADQPAVRVFAGVDVLVPETVTHLQSVAGAAEVLERSFGCPAAVWRDGLARLAAQRVSVATAEAVRPKPITGFLGMALAACEGLCC